MTSKFFNDVETLEALEFTTMFNAMSPEFRASVTLQALRARDHVTTDAGRALDSAIRGSIRLIGYTNPALAISSVLLEPVSNAIVKSEKLAGAALRVWADSHDDLHRLVLEHLELQGMPADYPDFSANSFRGFWREDSWQRELDWIVEFAENWSEDDLALMLCYVSGKTIIVPENESEEDPENTLIPVVSLRDRPAPPIPVKEDLPRETSEPPKPIVTVASPDLPSESIGSAILSQCIFYLDSLTPEDVNWNEAVPAFVEAVSGICELKTAQRERRANLAAAHREIAQGFAQDLEFLEQDMSSWSPEGLTDVGELDRTLDLTAELRSLLAEYQEVRRPGSRLSEELSRRERRFTLEPRILDTMVLVRQALFGARDRRDGPTAESKSGTETSEPADSAEPSGLPPGLSREPPLNRDGYQKELIYEPLEESRSAGEFTDS